MPDKWAQYAVPAAPATDKWAQYAQPAEVPPNTPPPVKLGAFDNNPGPGKPGGYEEALRPVGNFARTTLRDLGGMASDFVHPWDWFSAPTLDKIKGPGLANSPIADFGRKLKSDPTDALSDLAGHAVALGATGALVHASPELATGAGTGLRNLGASVDNAVIGTTAGDTEFGANPGRALSSNRLIGSNAAVLAPKLKALIPDAAAEHRAIIASNPSSATINVGQIVTKPFDDIVGAKTDPRTGVAAPAQIKRAGVTQRLLTRVTDPDTGQPTPMMRDPNLSPLEATQLKSNIYDMADYDNPSKSALSNLGLKGAAHGLKTAVEQAVPESVVAGQRLHDMMAARDILQPQAKFVKLPTSKSGVIDHLATTLGTTAGAGLDLTGAALQNVGGTLRFLKLPLLKP